MSRQHWPQEDAPDRTRVDLTSHAQLAVCQSRFQPALIFSASDRVQVVVYGE